MSKNLIINEFLCNYENGINEIKLKDLLALREKFNNQYHINSMFPPIEIGSITLVDQIVLLSLIDIFKPASIVEIGTYLGYTTSLFAMNSDAKIITIDLPAAKDSGTEWSFDPTKILKDGDQNDNFLRVQQNSQGLKYISKLSEDQKKRIEFVKEDSTEISFKDRFGSTDMIFIDGGHNYSIVQQDTKNAESCVDRGVIVWHDYGSNLHSGVNTLLRENTSKKIFHISGSLCAFSFQGY